MITKSFNKIEALINNSKELAESLSSQIVNIDGTLALLRNDINDSLDGTGDVQRSWADTLSVISVVLERLEADAEKLTDQLIEVQSLETIGKDKKSTEVTGSEKKTTFIIERPEEKKVEKKTIVIERPDRV